MVIERLGPAVSGYPFAGAAQVGERLVISSRNLSPATLVTYDLASRQVTGTADVPTGLGAWGVAARRPRPGSAGEVYAGQLGARGTWNLHRLDLATGTVEALAALNAEYLWDVAVSADGQVFVVASPNQVIRWDPGTGRASVVPGLHGLLDGVRCAALAGGTLVVGGHRGERAVIAAMDLATGTVAEASPPQLADDTRVYSLAGSAEHVVAGTQGRGMRAAGVALFALARTTSGRLAPHLDLLARAELPGEALVDAVAVAAVAGAETEVVATARRSGALYRVTGGSAERLAVPVVQSETRGLFVRDGVAVGVSAAEVVWSVDLRADEAHVERVDLLRAGLQARPQLPMSIAAEGSAEDLRVHVGGNFTLATHSGHDGSDVAHTFVPGEPKDLCVVDGDLIAAVYPVAQILRRRRGEHDFSLLAQLDPDQFRPVALVHDPARGQVLVSTAHDGGAGALHAVVVGGDGDGTVRMAADPFGDGQHPAGIAVDGDVAYLGGSGPRASLLAWDLRRWQPAWRVDAVRPDSGVWVGVAAVDGLVVLLGSFGWWVTVDPRTREVAVAGDLGADGGQLQRTDHGLFAVTSRAVWRLQQRARRATALTEDLQSRLWGWPFIAADAAGDLYAIAGLDVARIRRADGS